MSFRCEVVIIYKITNTRNSKVYIGMSTRGGNARWQEHIQKSKRPKPIMVVDQAIRKHGIENFKFEILETFSKSTEVTILEERERFFINKFRTFDKARGYNRSLGSRSNAGYKRSKKARLAGRQRASVSVHQYCLKGRYIRSFPSGAEAERKTDVARSSICHVLKGRLRQAGGFQWRSGAESPRKNIPALMPKTAHNKRRVYCFNKEGKLLGSYESISDAGKDRRVDWRNIVSVVDSPTRSSGGYIWSSKQNPPRKRFRKVPKTFGGRVRAKKVSVFNRAGHLLKTFESVGKAARELGISSTQVSKACKGGNTEVKTAKMGFCRFRYATKNVRRIKTLLKPPRGHALRVAAYDASGGLLCIYPSMTDAQNATGINVGNLASVASGERVSAGGYCWRYDSDEEPAPKRVKSFGKPLVCQYNFHGKLVATFKTALAAGKALGVADTVISRAAIGAAYSADGCFWRLFPREDVPKRIPTPPPLRGL